MAARIESSRRAYAAVNEGDIDAVLALTCPDVDWANALEGGRGHGQAAFRRTWARISQQFSFRLKPLSFEIDARGRVVVDAEVAIRDATGKPLATQRMLHVFTFRGDLIQRVDAREPPPPGGHPPTAAGRGGPDPPESGRDRRWDFSRQPRRRSNSSGGGRSPT
jgi:ketosteroid isomerase-like protein